MSKTRYKILDLSTGEYVKGAYRIKDAVMESREAAMGVIDFEVMHGIKRSVRPQFEIVEIDNSLKIKDTH
jgi:hypothetical protein